MNVPQNIPDDTRYPKAYVSTLATNILHLRNPIITALWSMVFPGFGHIILGSYIKGFLLVIWEIIINTQSHLNTVILFTFTGRFEEATAAADQRWLLLYIAVFVYALWDSYRATVTLNKYAILADRSGAPITRFKMNSFEINYFDKRSPWVAAIWSLLSPGLGHLYTHRLPTGMFVVIWWIVITFQSHLLEVFQFTLQGSYSLATMVANPQWLLFMPSIYTFAFYDSYVNTVEYNKLFDAEQANYLKRVYQHESYLTQFFSRREDAMFIIATFDHSIFIELAISDMEIRGIPRNQIFAAPMEKKQSPIFLIDTIHRADGVSTMDAACITGAFGSIIAAVYGFIWPGGPLLWGLIGLTAGFIIGGGIDMYISQKDRKLSAGDKSTEVVMIVNCEANQLSLVEEILIRHTAQGISKVRSNVMNSAPFMNP